MWPLGVLKKPSTALTTVLHYEFEGVNGSTNFVDLTGRHLPESRSGAGCYISTTNPLYGTSSLRLPDKNAYLASDTTGAGTNDFYFPAGSSWQIEISFLVTAALANTDVFALHSNTNNASLYRCIISPSSQIILSQWSLPTPSPALSLNTKYDLLVKGTKINATTTLVEAFLDGVLFASNTRGTALGYANTGIFTISGGHSGNKMNGYVDRVIVKKI